MNEKKLQEVMNEEAAAAKQKAEEQQQQEVTETVSEDVQLMNSLFAGSAAATTVAKGNQLAATAELTRISTLIANRIYKVATVDNRDAFAVDVIAATQNHGAMDDLINKIENKLLDINIDFLADVSEDEFERMIKSQQSKRSRAKTKFKPGGGAASVEAFKTMLEGAVAENLLRIASGKEKTVGGGAAYRDIELTEADRDMYLADEEKLTKAIRNIQSKISIYKHKAGFDETSPRYREMKALEAELKALRDGKPAVSQEAAKAIEVQQQLAEIIQKTDGMSAEEQLEAIKNMLASKGQ